MARLLACAVFAAAVSVIAPTSASAKTIAVNTTGDVVDNDDGRCSLREAVSAAALRIASGSVKGECPAGDESQPDVIQLRKKKTYYLTIDSTTDEDGNLSGDLDVPADLTFKGITIRGARRTKIVQRDPDQRVIEVLNDTYVTFERVTIAGGRPTASPIRDGGGILNHGRLRLTRVSIVGNSAGSLPARASGNVGHGGGVWNGGTLEVVSSTIASNAAGDGADATTATAATGGGSGGGIYSSPGSTDTITASTIANNRAGRGGSGLGGGLLAPKPGAGGGYGGGIWTIGSSNIFNSTFAGNAAGNGGNGGDGGTGASGNGQNGAAGGLGGNGGGVAVWQTGDISVTGSTISGNASGYGGKGGAGGSGVTNGNPGADGSGGKGGGVWTDGPSDLVNLTISGNTSVSDGGGLSVASSSYALLNNVTIARNVSLAGQGAGVYNLTGGDIFAFNSLIADNTSRRVSLPIHDCLGEFRGSAYNLVEDALFCTGLQSTDIVGRDPRLDKLRANGGPTRTHALKRKSPAIDAGNPLRVPAGLDVCEAVDQRGKTRKVCDIGAFEGLKKRNRR